MIGRLLHIVVLGLLLLILILVGAAIAEMLLAAPVARADEDEGDRVPFVVDLEGAVVWLPAEMAQGAAAVIHCESRWDPWAVGAAGERGLLMIHPVHADRISALGYTWWDMFDPVANLTVAVELWRERGWQPWGACAPW